MAGKAHFAAIPMRALGDTRLSALQLRALGIISHHDRMSLVTGKGQGCWASSRTMADAAGCDITNMSTAISQLAKLGYLTIDRPTTGDKRRRVYRVIFEAEGESLPEGQTSSDADQLPQRQTTYDDIAETYLPSEQVSAEVVCPDIAANPQKSANLAQQYISQSEERYSAKAGKTNSPEGGTPPRKRSVDFGFEMQLAQWEQDISDDPAGCVEGGLFTILAGARDRHASNNQYCREIDRLSAALATLRHVPVCQQCRSTFEMTRPGKRYCSERCRKSAEKNRHYRASRGSLAVPAGR